MMQGDEDDEEEEGHEELLDFIVDPAVVFGGVGKFCNWLIINQLLFKEEAQHSRA